MQFTSKVSRPVIGVFFFQLYNCNFTMIRINFVNDIIMPYTTFHQVYVTIQISLTITLRIKSKLMTCMFNRRDLRSLFSLILWHSGLDCWWFSLLRHVIYPWGISGSSLFCWTLRFYQRHSRSFGFFLYLFFRECSSFKACPLALSKKKCFPFDSIKPLRLTYIENLRSQEVCFLTIMLSDWI